MAAGIVYHNMTTSSGVTFAVGGYVPNTGAPDALLLPTQLPINSAGTVADFGSGATSAATIRVLLATDSPGVVALGQAASTGSLPVVLANDQSTIPMTEQPGTTLGLTLAGAILANSTNATLVKNSAGKLYKVECFNNSGTLAYIKFYNSGTIPTAGSGTPVWRALIPASTSGAGISLTFPTGLTFSSGIGYTVTTGIADADTGAVAATSYLVNIGYK